MEKGGPILLWFLNIPCLFGGGGGKKRKVESPKKGRKESATSTPMQMEKKNRIEEGRKDAQLLGVND